MVHHRESSIRVTNGSGRLVALGGGYAAEGSMRGKISHNRSGCRSRVNAMRLSAFLAIAVPPVARGQTMVSLQVPDSAQLSSWRVSLSPSWDVSSDCHTEVMV